MLRRSWQRFLTILLPILLWFAQKWLNRIATEKSAATSLDTDSGKVYHRVSSTDDPHLATNAPDTTAVILNWSRFPNVQRIASLLCSPALNGVIYEIFIWNNSPQKIYFEDFVDAPCPRSKLRIYNSPSNLYFQARFLACAQSLTPYCFIQDDDFIVLPEVIQSLHASIRQSQRPHTIHLLPAHEYLSSSLRQTFVHNEASPNKSIHTGFAWLGHGTFMHRAEVVEFWELMKQLNVSEEEMKMADNYYTILSNRVPEVWFDQGIELGGGQPFTVGVEGDERNNRHILQATKYLESILFGDISDPIGSHNNFPFVRTSEEPHVRRAALTRAACRDARCILESNIALVPETLQHTTDSASNMLRLERHNRALLSPETTQNYLEHPPSKAIDNRPDTYFDSSGDAEPGDFIQLDFFDDLHVSPGSNALEMVWVVDIKTERILRASRLSMLSGGLTKCTRATELVLCKDAQNAGENVRECTMPLWSSDMPHCGLGHVVRLEVVRLVNPPTPWRVHEVWVREL